MAGFKNPIDEKNRKALEKASGKTTSLVDPIKSKNEEKLKEASKSSSSSKKNSSNKKTSTTKSINALTPDINRAGNYKDITKVLRTPIDNKLEAVGFKRNISNITGSSKKTTNLNKNAHRYAGVSNPTRITSTQNNSPNSHRYAGLGQTKDITSLATQNKINPSNIKFNTGISTPKIGTDKISGLVNFAKQNDGKLETEVQRKKLAYKGRQDYKNANYALREEDIIKVLDGTGISLDDFYAYGGKDGIQNAYSDIFSINQLKRQGNIGLITGEMRKTSNNKTDYAKGTSNYNIVNFVNDKNEYSKEDYARLIGYGKKESDKNYNPSYIKNMLDGTGISLDDYYAYVGYAGFDKAIKHINDNKTDIKYDYKNRQSILANKDSDEYYELLSNDYEKTLDGDDKLIHQINENWLKGDNEKLKEYRKILLKDADKGKYNLTEATQFAYNSAGFNKLTELNDDDYAKAREIMLSEGEQKAIDYLTTALNAKQVGANSNYFDTSFMNTEEFQNSQKIKNASWRDKDFFAKTDEDYNGYLKIYKNDDKRDETNNFKNAIQMEQGYTQDIGFNPDVTEFKKYMTDEEYKLLLYWIDKDKDKAKHLYDDILRDRLISRYNQKNIEGAKEFAEKHPYLSIAGGRLLGLFSGAEAFGNIFGQTLKEGLGGDYIPNQVLANRNTNLIAKNTLDETVVNKIDSKTGKFFAETGISAADNIVGMAVYRNLYPVMMSVNAGGTEAHSGLERGLTKGQALGLGIANGTIEYVTEKLFYDDIMEAITKPMAKGSLSKTKAIARAMVSNMGSEFGEEFTGAIAQNITDELISGDKSQFSTLVNQYMVDGLNKDDAARAAFIDCYLKEPLRNGLSGGISGSIIGGAGRVVYNSQVSSLGVDVASSKVGDEMLTTALKSKEGTDSRAIAEEIQKKITNGERVTSYETGALAEAMLRENIKIEKDVSELKGESAKHIHLKDGGGVAGTVASSGLSYAEYSTLDALGRESKTNFVILSDLADDRNNTVGVYGKTNNGEKVAYLSLSEAKSRPIYITAKHELFHIFAQTEEGKEYTSNLIKNMKKAGTYETARAEKEAIYKSRKIKIPSVEVINEEIAADSTWKTFNDYNQLASKLGEDKGVINKVRNAYINFRNKISGAYGNATTEQGAIFDNMTRQEIDNIIENCSRVLGVTETYVGGKSEVVNTEERFSLSKTTDNKPVVVINDDITRYASSNKELVKLVKKYISRFKKVPINGQNIMFLKESGKEYTNSKYSKYLEKNEKQKYYDKMRLSAHPQDIIYATTNYINEGLKHSRTDNIVDFARGELLFDSNGNKYSAEVVIGFTNKGLCEMYDIVNITPINFEYKKVDTSNTFDINNMSVRSDVPTDSSIPQKDTAVNTYSTQNSKNNAQTSNADTVDYAENGDCVNNKRFSMSKIDSDYMAIAEKYKKGDVISEEDKNKLESLVEETAFKNGFGRKMYHGSTKSDNITVFKDWQYFTENENYAQRYASKKLYPVFAKVNNWFDTREDKAKRYFQQAKMEYGMSDVNERTGLPDWTDGYDICDYIDENDLDYDGVILDEGGDLVNGEVVYRGESYVIRKSNQVKSADPITYDDNGNVIPLSERFNDKNNDIRFSMSKAVEETKDLIAIHNITTEKLSRIIELGGFPMPSIAITKADKEHSNFGEISVLFDKTTIDPQSSNKNKVYGGDAYTPMFPQVVYRPNPNVVEKISDKYYELSKKYGNDIARPLYKYTDTGNAQEYLSRERGSKGVIENFLNDRKMQNAFLADKGIIIEPIYKDTVTRISKDDAKLYDYIISKLGIDVVKNYGEKIPGQLFKDNKKQWLEANQDAYEKALHDGFVYAYEFTDEQADNVIKNMTNSQYFDELLKLRKYAYNGAETKKTEIDTKAMDDAFEKAFDKLEYKKWLHNLFDGIEDGRYIRNNKELFTPTGNRRSFEQLHDEYNLENVLKYMQSEDSQVGKSFFGIGIAQLRAAAAKSFKSIAEIKKNKNRISVESNLSSDSNTDMFDELTEKWNNIALSIVNENQINDLTDIVVKALSKSHNLSGFTNNFIKENDGFYKVTNAQISRIYDFAKELSELPVTYFEAKPQRTVNLDEVKAVIVPNDIDVEYKTIINNAFDNVLEYEAGNDSDRLAKVNSVDDVRFSMSKTNDNESQINSTWAFADGVLSKYETKLFFDKISEINQYKNKKYYLSYDGDYVLDIGNKLVYTDGNYDYPTIYKVISFDIDNENLLLDAKEIMKGYEKTKGSKGIRISNQIIESIEGKKCVDVRYREDSETFRNSGKSGGDGKTNTRRTTEEIGEEIRYSASALNYHDETDVANELIDTYGEHKEEYLTKTQVELDIRKARAMLNIYKNNPNMIAQKKLAFDQARNLATSLLIADHNEFEQTDVDKIASKILNTTVNDDTYNNDYTQEFESGKIDNAKTSQELWDEQWQDAVEDNTETEVSKGTSDERINEIINKYTDENIETEKTVEKKALKKPTIQKELSDKRVTQITNSYINQIVDNKKIKGTIKQDIKSLVNDLIAEIANGGDNVDGIAYDVGSKIMSLADLTDSAISHEEYSEVIAELITQQITDELNDPQRKQLSEDEKLKDLKKTQKLRATKEKLLQMVRKLKGARMTTEMRDEIMKLISDIDTKSIGFISKGYDRVVTDENGDTVYNPDGTAKTIRVMDKLDVSMLREAVAKIKNENPNFVVAPAIQERIDRLSNRQIADMTQNEITDLLEVLTNFYTELQNARKLIDSERKENAAKISSDTIERLNSVDRRKGLYRKVRNFLGNHLAPIRFARLLVDYQRNSGFVQLVEELNKGQLKASEYEQRVFGVLEEFVANNKDFILKLNGKDADVIPLTNDTNITLGMLVSLYFHSRNKQAVEHMQIGGITVPNLELYLKGKYQEAFDDAKTVHITKDDIDISVSLLNATEKKQFDEFVNLLDKIYNVISKEALNETSRKLLGIDIAQVEKYYPISADKKFIASSDIISLSDMGTVESMGILKTRQQGAKNPIVLEDCIRTLTRHTDQTKRYYGFAIPMRNFKLVYGFSNGEITKNSEFGIQEMKYTSVQEAILKNYGSPAKQYFDDLITDIDSTRKSDNQHTKVISNLKKNAVQSVLVGNISVMLKQAASYPTAAVEVGWSSLAKAFKHHVNKADKNYYDSITPLLWMRRRGYSMAEIGDYVNGDNLVKKNPWLFGGIQKIDVMTVTKLCYACEQKVKSENPNLEVRGEEYSKLLANEINKMIENTQPNFTTMQRNALLRSNNEIVKILSMFKTQAYQNTGILIDAVGEYNAMKRDYKNKLVSKEDYNQSKLKLSRAISSQIIANLIVTAVTGLAGLLYRREKPWEDEDGNPSFEEASSFIAKNFISNFNGGFFLGSVLTSAVMSKLCNETDYGVEIPGLSNLLELNKKLFGVLDEFNTVTQNKKQGKYYSYKDLIEPIVKSISLILESKGFPINNIKKDMAAFGNIFSFSAESLKNSDIKFLSVPSNKIIDLFGKMEDTYNYFTNNTIEALENKKKVAEDNLDYTNLETVYDSLEADRMYTLVKKLSELSNPDNQQDIIKIIDEIQNNIMSSGYTKNENLEKIIMEFHTNGYDDQAKRMFALPIVSPKYSLKYDDKETTVRISPEEYVQFTKDLTVKMRSKIDEIVHNEEFVAADAENKAKYLDRWYDRIVDEAKIDYANKKGLLDDKQQQKAKEEIFGWYNNFDEMPGATYIKLGDDIRIRVPQKTADDNKNKETKLYDNIYKMIIDNDMALNQVPGFKSAYYTETSETGKKTKVYFNKPFSQNTPEMQKKIMQKVKDRIAEIAQKAEKQTVISDAKNDNGANLVYMRNPKKVDDYLNNNNKQNMWDIVAQSNVNEVLSNLTEDNTEIIKSENPVNYQLYDEAKKYLGIRYVYGGTTTNGFDCSGLMQYVYKQKGIDIPRTSAEQFEGGNKVGIEDLQVGDLVFFSKNGRIHHVGMYIGNNQMLHAPHTGDVVKVSKITGTYEKEYAGARRYY